MTLSLIAAMSENRVIGRAGGLPWRMPADMARFKRLTTGHPAIMGRRTFDSMKSPLPGRTNIVVTRRRDFAPAPGVLVAHDLAEAIRLARTAPGGGEVGEIFIIGGGEIYALALPRADRIHLTVIHARIEGDAFFPEFDEQAWRLTHDERREADEKNEFACSFRIYERREE